MTNEEAFNGILKSCQSLTDGHERMAQSLAMLTETMGIAMGNLEKLASQVASIQDRLDEMADRDGE